MQKRECSILLVDPGIAQGRGGGDSRRGSKPIDGNYGNNRQKRVRAFTLLKKYMPLLVGALTLAAVLRTTGICTYQKE